MAVREAPPLCFAIMPITTPEEAVARYGGDREHFLHVAEFIFKPAAELAGYRFVPASVDSSRVIQAAIIDNLARADVVLCDTSLWNANVFFELGIRVALNKPVALVRDGLTDTVPFDNTPVHCYEYDHRMEPWCLAAEIPKLGRHIAAAGAHEQNELWKFAGIQVSAQQTDAGNPEDAKLDLLLAKVAALAERVEPAGRASGAASASGLRSPVPPNPGSLLTDEELRTAVESDLARFNAAAEVDVGYLGRRAGRVFLETEKLPSPDERKLLTTMIGQAAGGAHSINYVQPGSGEVIGSDVLTPDRS
jgi:hypothetical protein